MHTPGPWRWEINENAKQVNLCGGATKFDLTVIDFVRWGMGGTTPRFRTDVDNINIMKPAIEWSKVVEGREHHAKWFKMIDHPDARLIASAPDLLAALKNMIRSHGAHGPCKNNSCRDCGAAYKVAREAIANAESV